MYHKKDEISILRRIAACAFAPFQTLPVINMFFIPTQKNQIANPSHIMK